MKCPYCAEIIKDEALKCKHCEEWLPKNQNTAKINEPQFQSNQQYVKLPMKLNRIVIHKNHFNYDDETHYYDEIIGLLFKKELMTINFCKISAINLQIKTSDNVFGARHIISKKNDHSIDFDAAIKYLDQLTFNNRINYYINQLIKNGYITYNYKTELGLKSSIHIFADGYIGSGNKKINLQIARQTGILKFGAEWQMGANYNSNPYEVVISEKKIKFAMQLRTLRIFTEWDTLIIQNIIRQLAEGKTF